MRNLRRRVKVERRIIRHHAAEKRDIHGGRGLQRGLTRLFLQFFAAYRQLGQRVNLALTDEKQRAGLFLALLSLLRFLLFPVVFLERNARRLQRFFSQFFRLSLRVARQNRLRQQLMNMLRPKADVLLRQHPLEAFTHGMLPALRRNARAHRAAVNGRFRASRIVPVHAARGNGFQHMKINENVFTHDCPPVLPGRRLFRPVFSNKSPVPRKVSHRARIRDSGNGINRLQA